MLQNGCVTRDKIDPSVLNDYYNKSEIDTLLNAIRARLDALEGN